MGLLWDARNGLNASLAEGHDRGADPGVAWVTQRGEVIWIHLNTQVGYEISPSFPGVVHPVHQLPSTVGGRSQHRSRHPEKVYAIVIADARALGSFDQMGLKLQVLQQEIGGVAMA